MGVIKAHYEKYLRGGFIQAKIDRDNAWAYAHRICICLNCGERFRDGAQWDHWCSGLHEGQNRNFGYANFTGKGFREKRDRFLQGDTLREAKGTPILDLKAEDIPPKPKREL